MNPPANPSAPARPGWQPEGISARQAALHRKSQQRRQRPLRRIVQKTGTACGLACVAMLARLSFREVAWLTREKLPKIFASKHQRTYAKDLRVLLKALGWRLGRQVKCRTWTRIPANALVAVQWKRKQDRWHWVVSSADAQGSCFLDPRKQVKTARRRGRDLQKVRPSWYHRVTPL